MGKFPLGDILLGVSICLVEHLDSSNRDVPTVFQTRNSVPVLASPNEDEHCYLNQKLAGTQAVFCIPDFGMPAVVCRDTVDRRRFIAITALSHLGLHS